MFTFCDKAFHLDTVHSKIVQGGKLLQYGELNCNSLENFRGWMSVLYNQSLLHRLFQWKNSTINGLQYTV